MSTQRTAAATAARRAAAQARRILAAEKLLRDAGWTVKAPRTRYRALQTPTTQEGTTPR